MLKPQIISQIKQSDKLISELATANNIKHISVLGWLRTPPSQKLTLHKNLTIIANFFGQTIEDLLITESV